MWDPLLKRLCHIYTIIAGQVQFSYINGTKSGATYILHTIYIYIFIGLRYDQQTVPMFTLFLNYSLRVALYMSVIIIVSSSLLFYLLFYFFIFYFYASANWIDVWVTLETKLDIKFWITNNLISYLKILDLKNEL